MDEQRRKIAELESRLAKTPNTPRPAPEVRYPYRAQRSSPIHCWRRGKEGHTMRDCRTRSTDDRMLNAEARRVPPVERRRKPKRKAITAIRWHAPRPPEEGTNVKKEKENENETKYEVAHRAGTKHGNVDGLSRRIGYCSANGTSR